MGTKASLQWSLEGMESEEGEKASAENSLLSLLTYVRLRVALLIESKNDNSNFTEVQPKEIVSPCAQVLTTAKLVLLTII